MEPHALKDGNIDSKPSQIELACFADKKHNIKQRSNHFNVTSASLKNLALTDSRFSCMKIFPINNTTS